MKDNYSFDIDVEAGRRSYNAMFLAYLRTFARLGLKALPMKADSGPIGGESHEFIILAETGESEVYFDKGFEDLDPMTENDDYTDTANLEDVVKRWTSMYAATDEVHDASTAPKELITGRGIEVGHIFFFGTKYSEPMGATVQNSDGEIVTVQMGSYGIGVSRLVGGIIEASHDDNGIIWPESVAPYDFGIINMRVDNEECTSLCDRLYAEMQAAGKDVLYDDRNERGGAKFSNMDLIGVPWQVIIGPKGVEKGVVELKNRKTGEREDVPVDAFLARFK
ncbi:MAG: proline--tRNA ligase, partial [Sphingomonadales bacterium]|nr:proline--tRNA ligase [Sphingomonadales bacterium]